MNQAGITQPWKESADVPAEDRERIRLAILTQVLGEGDNRGLVSVAKTREIAKIDGRKATKVVGDWKRGNTPDVRMPWCGGNQEPQAAAKPTPGAESSDHADLSHLAALALDADTHPKRNAFLRNLAASTLSGALKPADADKLRALVGEQRLQDKDLRTVPQDDPERVYLLSEDGARLAASFDRIVSNDRRARVLAVAADMLAEDVRELPAVDPVGQL